ncbi:hypothetical protein MSAN_00457700 [Mycena sanguinolenta]|uniref:F-box domain-containing protein n=1 Tax=Mycena sanguinolenta TaxID=230812 RepID=A0A8H7DHK1_9AGAR|nr:hypothetical protein MSAN_00457700 [Mycena sanguinolenta]
MGQGWQVVNVDRRETLGWWGKLGECLFDGSARSLNRILRVPPPLPSCDNLIFPFKPSALCNEATGRRGALYFPKTAPQSSLLVNLPVEMIWEIYSHMKDFSDIVCLTLTCQPMWNIGRRKIYDWVASFVAFSWAGDRIVCLGDYLLENQISAHEHLLTPEEAVGFNGFDQHDREYNFYNYPFCDVSHLVGTFSAWQLVHGFMLPRRIASLTDWTSYLHSFHCLVDLHYVTPTTQPAVLRNLSRHQYIRESALIAWKQGSGVAHAKNAGIGEIVLSRICFSTNGSVNMVWEGDIHRDVWAGDRLDIVAPDWLERLEGDADAWTDVSDEVLKEVEGIWRSEYEPDGATAN